MLVIIRNTIVQTFYLDLGRLQEDITSGCYVLGCYTHIHMPGRWHELCKGALMNVPPATATVISNGSSLLSPEG